MVGHWPVTLYDPHIPSAAPLLERERHIASIDGGCVLKLDGQLNALVLPRTAGGAFSWYSYDGLPKATALDPQTAGGDSVNIRWGRNRVEVLERGAELSAPPIWRAAGCWRCSPITSMRTRGCSVVRTPPTTVRRSLRETAFRWCGGSPTGRW